MNAEVERCELLAGTRLFSQLAPDELGQLVTYARVRHVPGRQVIFRKGEPGQQMFVIVCGRVKVSSTSRDGREMVFSILDRGELFGELAVFDGQARTATVTTLCATELMVLEQRDLMPFLARHPQVAVKLLASLSARLRATDELIEDTLFLELPARLAKKLLALADSYGRITEQGRRIGLKLSQQELANLVGASRESVNRILRAWDADEVIAMEHGRITLRAMDRLSVLAELSRH